MLGSTQAELFGKGFLDVTHPEDRAASLSAFQRFLKGGTAWRLMEKRYIRKDGAIFGPGCMCRWSGTRTK